MEKAKNFENLIVWQKGHEFVLATYKIAQASLEECKYFINEVSKC